MLVVPPIPVLFLLVLASLVQIQVCAVGFLLPSVVDGLLGCDRMIVVVIGIVIGSTISTARAQNSHDQRDEYQGLPHQLP